MSIEDNNNNDKLHFSELLIKKKNMEIVEQSFLLSTALNLKLFLLLLKCCPS